MALEAINQQLLRAVGVGIALFTGRELSMSFQNDVFESWFDSATPDMALTEVMPQIDLAALHHGLAGRGRYSTELNVRKNRRTLVLALIFRQAEVGGEQIVVLECQNITRIRELESMLESYSTMVERNTREIQREKERVEKLLLDVMPRAAYEEYKTFGIVSPQRFDNAGVLLLDFAEFGKIMDRLPPASFVGELNEIYGAFDRIGQQYGCERIKTTGDTYMAVAGLHDLSAGAPESAVANAAVRFVRYLRRRNANASAEWLCRIGLGSGPVIGSVIGSERYVYDVFGPAVTAATQAQRAADAMEILAAPSFATASPDLRTTAPTLEQARKAEFLSLESA